MRDLYSEIFGYVLIASAAALAWRESRAFRNRGADAWLITRQRYRRRILVSVVLGLVGALIAAWGLGYVDFRDPETGAPNPTSFTLYVLGLTLLSLFLLVLAILDFGETARNASRHALEEFSIPADKLHDLSLDQAAPATEDKPTPDAPA